MTKEIRGYTAEIEKLLNENAADWDRLGGEMLIRIVFYQHERLIHLIVTAAFAVMTILSFAAAYNNGLFLLIAGLFLLLDIPYVIHYFFLENSTQKLYKLYYEVRRKAAERVP